VGKSTGPILTAGALTWANQTIFTDAEDTSKAVEKAVQIGVATGVLAAVMGGVEKISPALASGLAYTALVTVLLVRVPDKQGKSQPTPLERLLSFFD
jgi:negative regulator of sigma E activity